MKCIIQSRQNERGQSMVELALTITFLMLLLAGTMDLGRAFFTWLAMRDAAQEGASYGSINSGDVPGVQDRVWDNLEQVIRDPTSHVGVSVSVSGHCLGDTVQVLVTYPFTITTPLLGSVIGDSIPIRATVNDTVLMPLCPSAYP